MRNDANAFFGIAQRSRELIAIIRAKDHDRLLRQRRAGAPRDICRTRRYEINNDREKVGAPKEANRSVSNYFFDIPMYTGKNVKKENAIAHTYTHIYRLKAQRRKYLSARALHRPPSIIHMSSVAGDCFCYDCAAAGADLWASCCRESLRCCSHLAAACRTCDQPTLYPFCAKHFKKCLAQYNEKKQN